MKYNASLRRRASGHTNHFYFLYFPQWEKARTNHTSVFSPQKCHRMLQEDSFPIKTRLNLCLLLSGFRLSFLELNLPFLSLFTGAIDLFKLSNKWEQGKRSDFLLYSLGFACLPLLKPGEYRRNENPCLAPSVEFILPEAAVSDTATGFFQRTGTYLQGQRSA